MKKTSSLFIWMEIHCTDHLGLATRKLGWTNLCWRDVGVSKWITRCGTYVKTPHPPSKLCQVSDWLSSYLPQSLQRRIPAPVPPSLSESPHSAAEAPRSGYPVKSQRWGDFGVAGLWHSSGPCPCLSSMWLCWFWKERKTSKTRSIGGNMPQQDGSIHLSLHFLPPLQPHTFQPLCRKGQEEITTCTYIQTSLWLQLAGLQF